MKTIPEINLKIETKEIPSDNNINITQMKEMFGKRIKKAIYLTEKNENGHCYEGLIHKKMVRLCKKWKFWNKDILEAYRNYVGYMIMPYIINYSEPIVLADKDFDVSKLLSSRYNKTEIDSNNY